MSVTQQTLERDSWPIRGLTGPPSFALVRRDFIGELRQVRSFYLVVLVLGLCILIEALAWPRDLTRFQDVGRAARDMFAIFGVIHLAAACVLPPGLAALAFASERRQDTLDQLRLSLISTLGLAAAKLVASVGIVALLFIGTLPVLGVQLMLVGVSVGEVLGLAAVVLMTAFMTATVGLLCAVVFRRPLVALVMSYIVTALALGGWIYVVGALLIPIHFVFGSENVSSFLYAFADLTLPTTPGNLVRLLTKSIFGCFETIWDSTGLTADVVAMSGVYRAAVGLLFFFLAARVLSRPPKPLRVPKERPIDDPQVLWERRHRFPYYLVDPLRRQPLIADDANPFLARELRHGFGMRLHVAFRSFVGTALVAGLLGIWWAWPGGGMTYYGNTLQLGMMIATLINILVVQVLVANVVTKEREQGNFGLLRMTLLTPYDFLIGKIGAGCATLTPYLLAVVVAGIPFTLLACLLGHGGPKAVLFGFETMMVCTWLTFCAAFFMSTHARTTSRALTGGLLLNLVIYAGPLLVYALISVYDGRPYIHIPIRALQKCLHAVSPLLTYADLNVMARGGPLSGAGGRVRGGIFIAWAASVALGFVLLALSYLRLRISYKRDE